MVSCCCFTTVCLGTPQPDVRPPGPDTVGVGRWAASSGPGGLPVKTSIGYMTARPAEDPHLWAQTLMDELEPLGFRCRISREWQPSRTTAVDICRVSTTTSTP